MKTFKEFMTQRSDSTLPGSDSILPGSDSTLPVAIIKEIELLLPKIILDSGGLVVTTKEVETKVLGALQNDEFLTKLSDQLPELTEELSEEEFVDRASNVARRLLEDFFK